MPISTLEPVSVISRKRNLEINTYEKIPSLAKNLKVTSIEKNNKKPTNFTHLNGPKLSNRALEIQKEEFLLSK
eukprot:jgi/Orpsp1_1/1186221/evm.model.d7180000048989.1